VCRGKFFFFLFGPKAKNKFVRGQIKFVRGKNKFVRGKNKFVRGKNKFVRGKNKFVRGKNKFVRGQIIHSHFPPTISHTSKLNYLLS